MRQGYEGRRAGEQQCEGTEARVGREGGGAAEPRSCTWRHGPEVYVSGITAALLSSR